MKGCGSNCACAQKMGEDEVCAPKDGKVVWDENNKCPCGKSKEDCCRTEASDEVGEINAALHELCDEHNGMHVCGIDNTDEDTAKTAD